MKVTALFSFFHTAIKVVRRFPLVWIIALLGSIALSLMVGDDVPTERANKLANVAQTCSLGIPLFFALSFVAFPYPRSIRWIFYLFGIALLLLTHYHLFHVIDNFNDGELSLHFLGYFLAYHLLASFLPVINKLNSNNFWHFNKILLLRAATTALYTGVLFAGLAGAIAALDQLLGLSVNAYYYARLWFFMAGLGSVWIFLAGMPDNTEELDEIYPKGLKVFAQYILLPLVAIYLLILYLYGAKIMVLGSLPIGWVSNLILAFAVIGMLAFLLLHPLATYKESAWIGRFNRYFYLTILPLLVLLYIATFTRLNAYGFTELRYALLFLSIWLTGITLYMIINRNPKIWIIPVSLFVTVLWVFFMPGWNLRAISKKSQTHRLAQLLKSNQMWNNGLIRPSKPINDSISNEMFEASKYLAVNHGISGLEPTVKIPEAYTQKGRSRYELEEWLSETLLVYGISGGLVYTEFAETVADTVAVAAAPVPQYEDLTIRVKGPNPSLVDIPPGNWSKCLDLEITFTDFIDDRRYFESGIEISRDVTKRNLLVSKGKVKGLMPLSTLVGNHIHALNNPSKNVHSNHFFPFSETLPHVSDAGLTLQIFKTNYGWDAMGGKYVLMSVEGKLWLP